MKALPFLQTPSVLDLRSQVQYSSRSNDLARMPKGREKNFRTMLLLRKSQLDKCTVLITVMWAYMFQKWLFQNGLGSADIHLEYLVSNSIFSEPEVKRRSSGSGKFYGWRPMRGTMFHLKIKALATASKIIHKTLVITWPTVTSLSCYVKISI